MKKILSFMAVMLLWAVTANAGAVITPSTDFAVPGFSFVADSADLDRGTTGSSNFYLSDTAVLAENHYIAWSDVSNTTGAFASWKVQASRGCYVSVSLDLGLVISSNKHIYEVKVLDANSNVKGTLVEPAENAASNQTLTLDGTILIPDKGIYTIELRNNRNWGKGTVKKITLTYAADAPASIVPVSSIELNKSALELEVDDVELLSATVLPDDAFDPSVEWTSDNTAVATVNANGLVTAVASGTANITAKAGEQTDVCAVTVTAASVPNVDFAASYALLGKKAHLDGAIWKNEDYKLYGEGGSNKHYGTASWTIHVTRPATVKGVLNGVEGGHIFELDLFQGDDSITTIVQVDGKLWAAGEINLDGYLTFPAAGDYTLKLRNTQEWSSGKCAGVTLTPIVFLAGDMTGWDVSSAAPMVEVEENIFMKELTLSGYHTFQIIDNRTGGNIWIGPSKIYSTLSDVLMWETNETDGDNTYHNIGIDLPTSTVVKFYCDVENQRVYLTLDPATITCTVAGASEILGASWDPAATANDMTNMGDSTFSLTKENVSLSAGDYLYKVAYNHTWGVNFGDPNSGDPDGNALLNVSLNGIYNVTFTFDWRTKTLSATPELVQAIVPSVKLAGDFTAWGDNAIAMEDGSDHLHSVLTRHFAAGEYYFQFVVNNDNWRGNTGSYTRTNAEAGEWWPFVAGYENSCKLVVDIEGDYTFKFRYNDEWGTVEFPSNTYIRAAVANKWGTLCLPFNATLDENTKAYHLAGPANIASGVITVEEHSETLWAGNTYLVRSSDDNITATMFGNKVTEAVEVNGLIGNLAAEPAVLAVNEDYDYYILSGGEFHQLTGTATASVAQYKGYLRIAKNALAPSQLRIVEAENNTTDVKSVEANEKAVKFFENGQLRILRDGVVYDATGRVVR